MTLRTLAAGAVLLGFLRREPAAAQTASNAAAPRSATKAPPRRDPPDQLFRRAPMPGSSRSIALTLSSSLHLAFDADLLRTEAAWAGPGLNLRGPPYTGHKTPFLCNYDGTTLWTLPPFYPWSSSATSGRLSGALPAGSSLRGISTKGGLTTLIYDVALPGGSRARVYERPRAERLGNQGAIVRRLEIGPCAKDLWWLAQAELGSLAASPKGGHTVVIRRGTYALLAVARGLTGLRWEPRETSVDYPVQLLTEQGSEAGARHVRVTGQQARAWLKIPAHAAPIAVEVATLAAGDPSRAMERARAWATAAVAPADMQFITGATKDRGARTPTVFHAERGFQWPNGGDPFYQIEHFPVPPPIDLRVTGMAFMPNGDLAICTWSGEIYLVQHPTGPVREATYLRFARGLDEPLGLAVVRGQIYVAQKCELTQVVDTDGDGQADLCQTVNAGWGFTGNYHAFAFGPIVDRQGDFYVAVTGLHGRWEVPFAGWCVRIPPEGGQLTGFCSGFRVPNGFGTYGPNDDIFFTDNEGEWIGACKLNHLRPGQFYGFPAAKPAPRALYGQPRPFTPPAVWFPRNLAPSASGLATIPDDRFGPFRGQMLVGDFQLAGVVRVALEKVDGQWQGAVWPFIKGFLSGVNRLAFGPDGRLYVGGLKSPAWAAVAPQDYSLDRVAFSGNRPFEVKAAHARADGFELVFTEPVDAASATNIDNYDVAQFTYWYRPGYGSPEIDLQGRPNHATPVTVIGATVAADRRSARLKLTGWAAGCVTRIRCLDVKSAAGEPLWHDTFYYTLNRIPRN